MPIEPYDDAAIERDIARHEAEKRLGVPALTVEEALAWLRRERERRRGHCAST